MDDLNNYKAIKKFAEFNTTLFNNTLPAISIKASNRQTRTIGGNFYMKWSAIRGFQLGIRIYNVKVEGGKGWDYILLHEMCHYALYLKYGKEAVEAWKKDKSHANSRQIKRASHMWNHTREFETLLADLWAKHKAGVTTPEPVKQPVKAPQAVVNAFVLGATVSTPFGSGLVKKIIGSKIYVLLPSGNYYTATK